MSIRQKLVAISKEVGMLDFKKTDFQGVDIYTSEYINSMIKPIFDKHGVVPVVNIKYDADKVCVTTQYIHDGEDDLIQTVEHPINTQLWGGGNITLATKYSYVLMFQIGVKDDVNLRDKVRAEAFGKAVTDNTVKLIANTFPDEVSGVFDGMAKVVKLGEDIVGVDVKVDDNGNKSYKTVLNPKAKDPITELINQVNETENLPELELTKPEPEEPKPSQQLFDRLNGGYEINVTLEECLSEVGVIKILDQRYNSLGATIYGHADLEKCPIPIKEIVDLGARRSNLKFRTPLIQYRLYGEEACWKALEAANGATKEELLGKLASPKKEQPKETPDKIVHDVKLPFEISENMGAGRLPDEVEGLLAKIYNFGLTRMTIIYALGKMKWDMVGSDDAIIVSFLTTASQLQIKEMIKLAMGAGG